MEGGGLYQSYTVQRRQSSPLQTILTRNEEAPPDAERKASTMRWVLAPQTGQLGSPPGIGFCRSARSSSAACSIS